MSLVVVEQKILLQKKNFSSETKQTETVIDFLHKREIAKMSIFSNSVFLKFGYVKKFFIENFKDTSIVRFE